MDRFRASRLKTNLIKLRKFNVVEGSSVDPVELKTSDLKLW